MNPELSQYVTELKVKFKRQPPDYQDILQEIPSQVPSLNDPIFRNVSEVVTQDHSHAKGCPNKGAYDEHGKLFIGNYPFHKWIDKSVKPDWYEICSSWSQGKDKNGSYKKYQDNKREQAQLETTVSELLTKNLSMEASIVYIIMDELSIATPMSEITGAGNYFGGRSEKVIKKSNKS